MTGFRQLGVLVLFVGLFHSAAAAQASPECAEIPGFATLDFWVGEWRVFVGDEQVGENRVEKILDGCAVMEHWTDGRGSQGRSLFYFNPATDTWKQVWITESATQVGGLKEKTLILELPDGGVRFRGEIPLPDGGSYLDRTTLTPLVDGNVRQLIEISRDGSTWEATFDAIYRPAGGYVPGPGDDWERRDPVAAGFDPDALREAIDWALAHETTMPEDPGQYLRDRFEGQPYQEIVGPTRERGGVNGILLRDGYIVAEWGDTRRVDMTFSVTKSYLSTVVGLAWDRGLIPDLDAPVAELVRDGGFGSPHNSRITWRHHLQQLSEWEGTLFGKPDQADRRRGVDRDLREPGTFWEYNDVRVNRLALSALRVWGEPLPRVLEREIMDPIGASDTWEWHGYETSWVDVDAERFQSVSGGGHWGGGMFISTRDHARYGLLFLRRGLWGARRLVSEAWIDEALAPSIRQSYGFMWWLNTDRDQFSNAPASSFFALGAGSTSTIWVDPDHDIVLVSRWIDGPQVDELIGKILGAVVR